jgi:hypothetical protein
MAETLGTLSDKLTIVKLKLYHTEDRQQAESLGRQGMLLQKEIDDFISDALTGKIPSEKLTFAANKVYKKEGNEINKIGGSLGEIFSLLAETNCKLWHVQEKVYEFETVPPDEKDELVKQLAIINLERNKCIDEIDKAFLTFLKSTENRWLNQSA